MVDGTGRIQKISFDPRIARPDTQTIAEAATEAGPAAQDAARRQNEELIREATGGQPVTLDMDGARRQVRGDRRAIWPAPCADLTGRD